MHGWIQIDEISTIHSNQPTVSLPRNFVDEENMRVTGSAVMLGWAVAVAVVEGTSGQFQFSASGWGCPFADVSTSPCYADACTESRSEGSISAECCSSVTEYCQASTSSADVDPACTGTFSSS